ncbi:MAG: NUDIX hydrolase [Deltaproteobacteria bacterium]|nr:NUDIX hydrolase [Deltaproteobacteria bacterium]
MKQRRRSPYPVICCAVVHRHRLLVLKRTQDPGAGQWALVSGYVERIESAEQAAVREVAEETGLSVQVEYLTSYGKLGTDGRYYLSMCFLGTAHSNHVQPNEESSEHQWVELDERVLSSLDWAFDNHQVAAMELSHRTAH